MHWNFIGRRVAIETVAFGKHPAYADFIQWRGSQSSALHRVMKSVCYDRIFPELQSQETSHITLDFVCASLTPNHLTLGRIASSKDSVGRDRIPFLCFARGPRQPVRFWFDSILAQLDRNVELLLERRDTNEITDRWHYFTDQLNEAWDRLLKQESATQSESERVASACPTHMWRADAFVSGLYRLVGWLPELSNPRVESRDLLLPVLGISTTRSLYFWLTFMSHLLPGQLRVTALADRTMRRITVVADSFPRRIFANLNQPTEMGAFCHELPSFQSSGEFLGILHRVQNRLDQQALPTAKDLEMRQCDDNLNRHVTHR